MSSLNTQQIAFEEWCSRQPYPNFQIVPWPEGSLRDDGLFDGPILKDGQYFSPQTQAAWIGWQASQDPGRKEFEGDYINHIKLLQAEVAELKLEKFRRFNDEDCWIYEGNGEDHLESLTCPVVISAQKLLELLLLIKGK